MCESICILELPPTVTMTISFFLNIFLSLSLSLLPWTSNAFTLKLLHRDSPHSPLYQSNLSEFDRFTKNTEISNARASYFEQFAHSQSIGRLPLKYVEPLFTVEIGLGTPVVKKTLILDTGSSLTWAQCKPCILCFKQDEPLFDPKRSRSYKKLTGRHKLSSRFTCNSFECFYYVRYYSQQFTLGTVSLEKFTFQTSKQLPQTVPNLVFGCGKKNIGHFPSKISGILGMSREPVSFARQLGNRIKERFSYCLNSNAKESYITFGNEAKIQGNNTQRTTFMKGQIFYSTKLNDISIEGQTMRLTNGVFPGGCVIDSGSSFSLLNKRAFFATTSFFTTYLSKHNVRRYVGKDVPEEFVCYTQPKGLVKLPSMTFHFQGADFHVPPENLFFYFKDAEFFCLAMMGSPNTTILGAFQQRNVRIVYDLKEEMLSFAPEKC